MNLRAPDLRLVSLESTWGRRVRMMRTQSEGEEDGKTIVRAGDAGVWTFLKLAGLVGVLLTLFTVAYTYVLDSKLDRLELRLSTVYASRAEAVTRAEYELRHKELINEDERVVKRVERLEKQMDEAAQKFDEIARFMATSSETLRNQR